jgi:hypothetical protein
MNSTLLIETALATSHGTDPDHPGDLNAQAASWALGFLIVGLSLALGGAELLGFEWSHFALPLGSILFALAIEFRICARSDARIVVTPPCIGAVGNPNEGAL